MALTIASSNTLLGAVQPKSNAARLWAAIVGAFLGTVLITIAAKTNVPTWPVPVTLQSLAIAVIAGAFGFRMAVATVGLYLAQGLAGIPVFAGATAGVPYVLGPTGGFLFGFLIMAAIIGFAADRGLMRNVLTASAAMIVGNLVMFGFGFIWLLTMAEQAGWIDMSNPVMSAFDLAVSKFIVLDMLKMVFAALTVVGGAALLKRR